MRRVPSTRRPRTCTALMLDSADRYGRADPGGPLDADALVGLTGECRRIWPRHAIVVSQCVPGTAGLDAPWRSPYFTDALRLRELLPAGVTHVAVVRPSALILPAATLRAVCDIARTRRADIVTLAGVPADAFHVASTEALALVASLGLVPRCVTAADAVRRLMGAGGRGRDALTTCEVGAADVAGHDERLVRALPPSAWTAMPSADVLALSSPARLAAAIRLEQQAFDSARGDAARWRDARGASRDDERRAVLVTVPSRYQSGANAAWEEVSASLSPQDVAFVVGGGTALAASLASRGFTVFATLGGPASGVADTAVWLEAMARVRPDVVHFDGAEGNTWAPIAFARGARVVQHVRLNDPDRYRPAFGFADAVVTVSKHLHADVVARVGPAVRVEHIADGVRLHARARRERRPTGECLCLCIGRIEPEKGQLRVLDIVSALHRHRPCRLVLLGSCGSDPAYCDEVTRRLLADAGDVPATWHSFAHPIDDWYAKADVVLVGSRNEALGMVGLEALAAGCLLVAQRSRGYASIVDEPRGEGVLFDADEPAADVAVRAHRALDDAAGHAERGRRKVESAFDARVAADRLAALWRDLRQ